MWRHDIWDWRNYVAQYYTVTEKGKYFDSLRAVDISARARKLQIELEYWSLLTR